MKELTAVAKAKVDGVVKEFPTKFVEYESLQEAEKLLGKEKALGLLNRMVKTDALNAARQVRKPGFASAIKNASDEDKKKIAEILKKYGVQL